MPHPIVSGFLLSFPMKSTVRFLLPKPPQPQELILFLQRDISHHWQGPPATCLPGPGPQQSEEEVSFKSSPRGPPRAPAVPVPQISTLPSPFLQAHEGLRPSQDSPGIWGAAGGGEWHGEAVRTLRKEGMNMETAKNPAADIQNQIS